MRTVYETTNVYCYQVYLFFVFTRSNFIYFANLIWIKFEMNEGFLAQSACWGCVESGVKKNDNQESEKN